MITFKNQYHLFKRYLIIRGYLITFLSKIQNNKNKFYSEVKPCILTVLSSQPLTICPLGNIHSLYKLLDFLLASLFSSPVLQFQTRKKPSIDPLAKSPFGSLTSDVTSSLCPIKVIFKSPVSASQIIIVWSQEPLANSVSDNLTIAFTASECPAIALNNSPEWTFHILIPSWNPLASRDAGKAAKQ